MAPVVCDFLAAALGVVVQTSPNMLKIEVVPADIAAHFPRQISGAAEEFDRRRKSAKQSQR